MSVESALPVLIPQPSTANDSVIVNMPTNENDIKRNSHDVQLEKHFFRLFSLSLLSYTSSGSLTQFEFNQEYLVKFVGTPSENPVCTCMAIVLNIVFVVAYLLIAFMNHTHTKFPSAVLAILNAIANGFIAFIVSPSAGAVVCVAWFIGFLSIVLKSRFSTIKSWLTLKFTTLTSWFSNLKFLFIIIGSSISEYLQRPHSRSIMFKKR